MIEKIRLTRIEGIGNYLRRQGVSPQTQFELQQDIHFQQKCIPDQEIQESARIRACPPRAGIFEGWSMQSSEPRFDVRNSTRCPVEFWNADEGEDPDR